MRDPSIPILALQIQALVHEHFIHYRATVQAAVEAALKVPMEHAVTRPDGRTQRRKPARRPTRRRTAEEMAELGERFYGVVCEHSGETMAILAPLVGVSARELKRPVASLKKADRVRSVGQRSETRYFPKIGGSVARTEVNQ